MLEMLGKMGGLFVSTILLAACSKGPPAPVSDPPPAPLAVALEGDTAVVGVNGAAYVFERDDGFWTRTAKLVPGDGASEGRFGSSVAISGDTILVGAPDDEVAGFSNGAAYVFVRKGTSWSLQSKLLPDPGKVTNIRFGSDLAVSGDTAVVLSSGGFDLPEAHTPFVFERSGDTWAADWQLNVTEPDSGGTVEAQAPLALDGDTAVVGATVSDDVWEEGSSLRVFTRSSGSFVEQASIAHADPWVGYTVALSGDRLIVGSYAKARIFARTGGGWVEEASLAAPASTGDTFGDCLGISGDRAVVCAGPKRAFTFTRSGGAWAPDLTVTPVDCLELEEVETAMGASGDRAVVAGWYEGELELCELR